VELNATVELEERETATNVDPAVMLSIFTPPAPKIAAGIFHVTVLFRTFGL
jgi:hypothetical protein